MYACCYVVKFIFQKGRSIGTLLNDASSSSVFDYLVFVALDN